MAAPKELATSPSMPSTRERALSCTHLQLTRLFDNYGCEQCSICHRRPQLGWLYRCTQDFNGFLPASDFYDVDDHKRYDHDAQLYTLSAAVTKAAANGDYTDQELDILWKQKLEVRRTIRQVRPETSSTASTATSSQYSLPVSTKTSTVRSSDSDPDTEVSQLSDYLQPCRGPLEPIREVHDDLENEYRLPGLVKPTPPTPPTPCSFKVCHTCRPIYQQRAWQSIDGVLKGPYKLPPKHELANRRITDPNTVKNIGLHLYTSTPHIWTHPDVGNDGNQRNSRTHFQDIVQRLLRAQERPSEDHRAYAEQEGHLERARAAQSLCEAHTKAISEDAIPENASRISSNLFGPLYHRRCSERQTSIQPSFQNAASECDGSTFSAQSPLSSRNRPFSAVTGLKIDTIRANEDRETIVPAQKTPTESIKDSLCRFGGSKKAFARFMID